MILYPPMKGSDYPDLYALWLSCKGMGLNNLDDSEEGIRRFLKRNPSTCYTATEYRELVDPAQIPETGNLTGFLERERVVGSILAGHDGRRGYIYHTAVAPDHRRQGIGRKLVELAMGGLREEGIHKVALVVFSRNQDGNAFWERLGFTVRTDLTYRNLALTELIRTDT